MNFFMTLIHGISLFISNNFSWWLYSATHLRNLRYSKLYCALSNLHDLNRIEAMLSEDVSAFGVRGKGEVMQNKRSFYNEKYPDPFWIFKEFRIQNQSVVEFDFQRFWTDKDSGQIYSCFASEYIIYSDDGKIIEIDYIHMPVNITQTEYPSNREVLLDVDSKFVTDHVDAEF
mmetsp:Transcript_17772/g.17853  ORF Transcript_17772/g.17853 Transcript_17772/m.17853 type:complete len:173 (+) Transcript_17772:214-732(+)